MQEDARKYDAGLVQAIRDKSYSVKEEGVEVLMKPVPDAVREHALDPRLKELIEYKKKMFAGRAAKGWTLSSERYRPDKVTYDLTEGEVAIDERLIDIDGDHMIDIYVFRPAAQREASPILVYLHGGGFTAGDIRLFGNQMKLIAERSGCVVVFPEYRLAPECPFPGPANDAWGAVRWVAEHAGEYGADGAKLMVAGDSAGGSLTNACAIKDIEAGDRIIKKILGIYPSFDGRPLDDITEYAWSYDAYEVVDDERELAVSRIDRIKSGAEKRKDSSSNLYLQGRFEPTEPLVSAVCAPDEVLARFPKTTVIAAEYDYLRVGSDYAASRLANLGVDVRSVRYLGCDHGFLDMLGTIVQSEELCWTIADELTALA